jgi:hypothetical protein
MFSDVVGDPAPVRSGSAVCMPAVLLAGLTRLVGANEAVSN